MPIFNGNSTLVEYLSVMWGSHNSQKAYETLSKDDVTVTNEKDKDTHLAKILQLNDRVRRVLGQGSLAAGARHLTALFDRRGSLMANRVQGRPSFVVAASVKSRGSTIEMSGPAGMAAQGQERASARMLVGQGGEGRASMAAADMRSSNV